MLLGAVVGADVGDWRRMIEVNLLGLLYCTHAALPLLEKDGGGDIVNVSSVAGRRADAGAAVYNMTKFGVHAFSEALRQEVLHAGTRVTTVAPGFVETELQGHNKHPVVQDGDGALARADRRGAPARGHRRGDRASPSAAPRTCASTRSSSGPRARPANYIQTYVITYRDVSRQRTRPHVGPRVRALREAMDLSLRDLAERSGVSAPMLSPGRARRDEPDARGRGADRGGPRADAVPAPAARRGRRRDRGARRRSAAAAARARPRLRGPHAAAARAARRGVAPHARARRRAPAAPATRRCTSPAAARPRSSTRGRAARLRRRPPTTSTTGDAVTFDADLPHHFENPARARRASSPSSPPD